MNIHRIKVIDGALPEGIFDQADMEPVLHTSPEVAAVRDELLRLEPLFHRPEHGISRDVFERMMAPGFWEVGTSGRRYSREFILRTLEQRYKHTWEEEWELHDFHFHPISPDTFLATYTLHQGPRITRRATIWRRTPDHWEALYHQGTPVS